MRRRALLAAAGLCCLAACATLAARRPAPPDQDLVRLPHQKHRAADLECAACHAKVAESTTLEAGRLLPREETCLRCHGEWKASGRCSACHLTAAPQGWPDRERRVRLSHAGHLRRGAGCSACHTILSEPGAPAQPAAPMGTCLACHVHQAEYDQARCAGCHVDLTRVPLRPVASFSHQGNYLLEHRQPGRASPEACAQCHDEGFCADCHARTAKSPVELIFPDRVDRAFVHRNDFLSRHPLEARADEALCLRCHSTRSCDLCHRERGVSPAARDPRSPHPPGWAASGHGAAARRDVVSCAACHDQGAASNCVGCHRVGGIGGSPHPPGFSRTHDREDVRRERMCLTCH